MTKDFEGPGQDPQNQSKHEISNGDKKSPHDSVKFIANESGATFLFHDESMLFILDVCL